ncbi:MAG: 23S rRNA (adenine(2503)-C(2))-methyltransferase RlmN [Spirochaetia bacterium]|nr:23S rRNA (adenine(2503)-C(2))-methyltransferase RlmN [Spirochaetia bacterium]
MAQKPHLLSLTLPEWEEYITNIGHKNYRAKQIFEWLHQHTEMDLSKFSNVPDAIKKHLINDFSMEHAKIIKQIKSDDGTEKILFSLLDGKFVETVWLRLHNRNTVCVSTQAGCSLYCQFCMTASGKFMGNLSTGEILEQIYTFKRVTGEAVNNVVFMGMGEPLMNYENTIKACALLNSDFGLNIGARRITVSTAGVLPGIKKFIENAEPYNLALSLNSMNSDIRSQIMDIEKKWPISDIIDYLAQNRIFMRKNKITLEYILIHGLNMSFEDAVDVSQVAHRIGAKVNLIPLNHEFNGYMRPDDDMIQKFWQLIKNNNVEVFNRVSQGYDIRAACGMLKSENLEEAGLS